MREALASVLSPIKVGESGCCVKNQLSHYFEYLDLDDVTSVIAAWV